MKHVLTFLLLLLPFIGYTQCDVFIEPGSVQVTDNGSGVKFTFDVTNNSSADWYGDVLKMYWSLNSGAPIWNIDYSTDVNQPPIAPGETRTIKTPWFDIPNLPSWFPDDPTTAQPWEESMEWPYYGLSFPFQGSWSPMNLRLGSCGLADGTWVYDDNGDSYYGPFNTDCPDLDNDAFCDCDLEITNFDPNTLDISVEVISHWNCGQPLNIGLSPEMDGINHVHFGIHVPGWDYQWGCTTGINHPGWAFTGWAALGNPNLFLHAGDILEVNLLDNFGGDCFLEILSNDTLSECPELVLWQINYSQTLLIADGGWAVGPNFGNNTQSYPDDFIQDNSILICESIDLTEGCTDPAASNYIPEAILDDGSCEYDFPDADPTANINEIICNGSEAEVLYNIFVNNYGADTLFQYCVEIPELEFDECYNGYQSGNLWIEPGAGQFITTVNVPSDIGQFTIIVYNAEGEQIDDNSNNTQIVNVNIPGDECDNTELIYIDLYPIFGCDTLLGGYYIPEIMYENTGNTIITEFCAIYDIFGSLYDEEVCWEGELNPGDIAYISFPPAYADGLGGVYIQVNNINGQGGGWTEIEVNINYAAEADDQCTYGCTDSDAINYNENANVNDNSCEYPITELTYVSAECYVDCDLNGPFYYVITTWTNTGNTEITNFCAEWDVLGGEGDIQECWNGNLLPGDTVDLQFGPYTTNGSPVAWAYLQVVNGITLDPQIENYETLYCYEDAVASCIYGCTDATANNYDPTADLDDGSCIYSVFGCTDESACNYDPDATDDNGSCNYDCYGCTDSSAINYNPLATIDDGSCEYDVFGCTDPNATNYNPLATVDDGSCEYIIYLGGCTDPEAINYNAAATYDDGSCVYDPCSGMLGAVYYAPNTFTPNNDGVNDGWAVITDPGCWLEWHVLIYSRWGQLIWESHTPGEIWPGSYFDGNYYVADGVYFYKITGVGYNPANTFQTTGNITIFR